MAGLNKVILIGRLGADPETKSFSNGGKIVNLRLATSETWKDKQTGERKEKTEWHSVVIQNDNLAGIASQYLKKGSEVAIEGKLQTRKWQDQQGNDRYATEVVVGLNGSLTLIGGNATANPPKPEPRKANAYEAKAALMDELDDEVPF